MQKSCKCWSELQQRFLFRSQIKFSVVMSHGILRSFGIFWTSLSQILLVILQNISKNISALRKIQLCSPDAVFVALMFIKMTAKNSLRSSRTIFFRVKNEEFALSFDHLRCEFLRRAFPEKRSFFLNELRTSRDRPKSAPYLRLKNSKRTSMCQLFSSTVPAWGKIEKNSEYFLNFFSTFLVSGKIHSAEKC